MNIFEQFGLKEVANVTFYNIETGLPELFLDSLKVSTIEQTAENVDARGGWGNPALVSWDYNKEVNVTLEDALFSSASLKVMMGAKSVEAKNGEVAEVSYNELIKVDDAGKGKLSYAPKAGKKVYFLNEETNEYEVITVNGQDFTVPVVDKTIRVFYVIEVNGTNGDAVTITIDAGTFGGTYRLVGDTVVRSRETGKDEPFQFVMEKVKVNSEVTFTMEAEGDPATFNMPIKVLKDDNGNMFKLIKYNLPTASM